MYIHTYIQMYMCVHIYIYICMCMCMYVYIYIYIYMYTYIHTYRHMLRSLAPQGALEKLNVNMTSGYFSTEASRLYYTII